MNRTTLGYFIMVIGSAGIVWAVVQFGKRLEAPPDWSGNWWVLEPSAQAKTARFDQSGIYLHLKVGNQPTQAYRMQRSSDDVWLQHGGQRRQAVFTKYDNGDSLVIAETEGHPTLKLWRDAAARNSVERDGTGH